MSENGEIYTAGKKFYTATGSDGSDKYQLWDRQELHWREEILNSSGSPKTYVSYVRNARHPFHTLIRAICLECPVLSAEPSLTSFIVLVANIKTIIQENFPKCLEGFQQLAILWLLCDVSWCFYFPVKWLRLDDFEIDRSLSPPSVLLLGGSSPSLCEWPNYTTCFYLFIKTWVVLQMFLLLTLRSTY